MCCIDMLWQLRVPQMEMKCHKKPEFDEGRTQAGVMFYSNTPRRVG